MIVRCPSCGADVAFRYDDSLVRVCDHCRSAVARGDRSAETLGRFADLVPIDSPLALFAEGRHDGVGFQLIGMAQLRHAAGGLWQEWYARQDDGRWAWLSEAQGRLYVTYERPDVPAPPLSAVVPGAQVVLDGTLFTVAERGQATYVAARGEIPYRLVPRSTFEFADLSDGRGGFATIDYGDGSEPSAVYLGRQVAAAGLQLSGGEAVEPSAQAAQGQRLACPNCNGSLELRAPDRTLRVACPYCGSLVDVEGGALAVLARQADRPELAIALGSIGRFADGELTVIGRVGRSARIDGAWWPFEEYLLFAPATGFRWLVCSDGHWSYVQPVAAGAIEVHGDARYGGVVFRRFQHAALRVDHVVGEFYWRVEVGECVVGSDYIAPPAMLSLEASGQELNGSLASYLTPAEVERAFGKRLGLAAPVGVAPNQPFAGGVGKVTALVTALFVAVSVGKCASAANAERARAHFTVPMLARPPASAAAALATGAAGDAGDPAAAEATGSVVFSAPFRLEGGQNVAFEFAANLRNNWVEAALDLVNDDTHRVISFDSSLAYYSGVEDGESWSEGAPTGEHVIGPVEPGNYVLRLEAQHGGLGDVELDVVVRQGVFRWWRFWAGLGVLALPFVWIGLRAARFRRARWDNSNLGTAGADAAAAAAVTVGPPRDAR